MTGEKTASEQVRELAAAIDTPPQPPASRWSIVAAFVCLLLAGSVVWTTYCLEERAQNTSVALANIEASGEKPTQDGVEAGTGEETALVAPMLLAAGTSDGDSGSPSGDGGQGTAEEGTTGPTGPTGVEGATEGEPATEGPGEAPWAFAIAALGAAVFLLTGRALAKSGGEDQK